MEQATVGMIATLALGRVVQRSRQPDQLLQPGGDFGLNHGIRDHLVAQHRSYLAAGECEGASRVAHQLHGDAAIDEVAEMRDHLRSETSRARTFPRRSNDGPVRRGDIGTG